MNDLKGKNKTDIYRRTFNGSVFLLVILSVVLFSRTSLCSKQNDTLTDIVVITENLQDSSENTEQKNIIKQLTVSKNLVNINSASVEELTVLKGIGITTAEKIVRYRTENGGFKSAEDLMKVKGIGPSKFSAVKDLIDI
ncbi:MAG: helix-hairpin-helix domain-containing protein [Candidatus Delongbacteria bacterium]|nr:helix-hairpin-helix domain-containing protein [Candidatus Delongbacteria bacterium]